MQDECNGLCRPTAMQYDSNCPVHGWVDVNGGLNKSVIIIPVEVLEKRIKNLLNRHIVSSRQRTEASTLQHLLDYYAPKQPPSTPNQ